MSFPRWFYVFQVGCVSRKANKFAIRSADKVNHVGEVTRMGLADYCEGSGSSAEAISGEY